MSYFSDHPEDWSMIVRSGIARALLTKTAGSRWRELSQDDVEGWLYEHVEGSDPAGDAVLDALSQWASSDIEGMEADYWAVKADLAQDCKHKGE